MSVRRCWNAWTTGPLAPGPIVPPGMAGSVTGLGCWSPAWVVVVLCVAGLAGLVGIMTDNHIWPFNK